MTNLQLYLAGWKGMWYVVAIFVALVVITYLLERRDKLEKKMAKAHQRHNVKRTYHKKHSA